MFGKILMCPEKICMSGKIFVTSPSRSPTFLGKEILISDSAKCDSTPPPPTQRGLATFLHLWTNRSIQTVTLSVVRSSFFSKRDLNHHSCSLSVLWTRPRGRSLPELAILSMIGLSRQFSGDPNHFGPFNHSSVNCPPLLPKWNKKYSYWNIMPLD